MVSDWYISIGDIVMLPFAYSFHNFDKDSKSEHRKDHIHLILVFPNTTTYNHALSIFRRLSADGKQCCNKIEPCYSVRHCYDYLIHDTETCRQKGKTLYLATDRVCGNNFDIGLFEQLSTDELKRLRSEIVDFCIDNCISNLVDLTVLVSKNFDYIYREVLESNSSMFANYCKANYLKYHCNDEKISKKK